ncbi:MAG: hypothetical protein DI582_01245 [Azospirillum brasilense]|nr:MAG: hypothetical protein DI582_01245 [Azospirillum brasilense]
MRHAFSLVELSIVLVILGLLTGGILGGQSLIRAAELRSAAADMQRYQSAMYTFRDKYLGLPGDITNAEQFWGTDPDGCPIHTNWSVKKSATCNGNGNGQVTSGEMFRAWQQLANAGLIEGSYTGVPGPNNSGTCTNIDHEIGVNVPAARLKPAGFGLLTYSGGYVAPGAVSFQFEGNYSNTLILGASTTSCETAGPIMKPEEAWNIDTKMDDGKPGMGKLVTRTSLPVGGPGVMPNCNDGDNTMAASAQYRLDFNGVNCSLLFRTAL